MGQEQSSLVDDSTLPATLTARNVDAVARYIKSKPVKRVVVLTGAGISTAAGIPDFRSPETGLYANLARLDLPHPEAVFDISYFRKNPRPFYALAHELYPGKYEPTIAHVFVRMLHEKNILSKVFTQNVDCLERAAGIPPDKIVEAHGSFATQRCIECRTPFPEAEMRRAVQEQEVPHCQENGCTGLVKPDIVFFGESLPESFFLNRSLPGSADLCIIIGTSLSVQPFASLPQLCQDETPRILINNERVGGLGSRADDVLVLGDCDAGVRKLAAALGWLEELESLWREISPEQSKEKPPEAPTSDDNLEDKIAALTQDVDATLQISEEHAQRLKDEIEPRPTSIEDGDEKRNDSNTKSAIHNEPTVSDALPPEASSPAKLNVSASDKTPPF